jgi:hypothetical protein
MHSNSTQINSSAENSWAFNSSTNRFLSLPSKTHEMHWHKTCLHAAESDLYVLQLTVLIDCCSYAANGLYFGSIPGLRNSHNHHHHCCTKLHCPTRGVNRQWGRGRPSASIIHRSVTQPQHTPLLPDDENDTLYTTCWVIHFINTCHVYKLFTFFLSVNNFYFGFHSLIMNLFLLFRTLSTLLYFPDIIRVYIFFIKCKM